MILSDNETIIDRLNNHAIAETIVSIIKDSKESVSIGVHGDWGAGKSSVLAMVEADLNPKRDKDNENDYIYDWDKWENLEESDEFGEQADDIPVTEFLTVRFNSWQYQGFEDAKIALMSAIVKALEKKAIEYYKEHPVKGAIKKLRETCERIWKNLDKLSLAKNIGKFGVSIATGTTPLALLDIGVNHTKKILEDNEKMEEFIGFASELLKKSSADTSSYKEMTEFRINFKSLFKEAHIQKLVVLIDDLDRCLPKVAIETLEAVRMILSLDSTAFIIAADDAMIRYSVKEYFPRIQELENGNPDAMDRYDYNHFSDKYLEKLIQIPLHIPRIGIAEAQLYIMLLLIESKTGDSEGFKNLVKLVLDKLHKPWALQQLTTVELKNALGDEYQSVVDNVIIAKNIDRILAENTGGNPRNIKRFVNMLLLRTAIAHNRGFDEDDIKMSILAKMMLAEQYNYDFYKAIVSELDDDGTCPAFEETVETEEASNKETDKEPISDNNEKKTTGKTTKKTDAQDTFKPTFKNDAFGKMMNGAKTKTWMEIEPSLSGVDLRPYFFACTVQEDFFFSSPEERLRELLSIVRGGAMNVINNKQKISDLDEADAKKLFNILSQDVFTKNLSDSAPPKSIEGLRRFVEFRQELQEDLASFLLTLPENKLGIWALGEWDACIPQTCSARIKLNQFYKKIEENGATKIIREKAKQVQE